MDFVLKMRDFIPKLMDFHTQSMDSAGLDTTAQTETGAISVDLD